MVLKLYYWTKEENLAPDIPTSTYMPEDLLSRASCVPKKKIWNLKKDTGAPPEFDTRTDARHTNIQAIQNQ